DRADTDQRRSGSKCQAPPRVSMVAGWPRPLVAGSRGACSAVSRQKPAANTVSHCAPCQPSTTGPREPSPPPLSLLSPPTPRNLSDVRCTGTIASTPQLAPRKVLSL